MSILMERYMRAAGISTPMGRVLNAALTEADEYGNVLSFIRVSGRVNQPGAEIPETFADIAMDAMGGATKRLLGKEGFSVEHGKSKVWMAHGQITIDAPADVATKMEHDLLATNKDLMGLGVKLTFVRRSNT